MTRFTDAATARGLAVEVHTFPAGTRTAADAAAAVGCEVGAIVKSLVFVVDDLPRHEDPEKYVHEQAEPVKKCGQHEQDPPRP